MENQNSSKMGIKIIGAILVLAGIAYGFVKFSGTGKENGDIVNNDNTLLTPPPTTPPPTAIVRKYKDGTYTASGNYTSPAQKEEIKIELVIKDDVISAATFFENPSNPTTKIMQGKFKAGFSTLVIGKSVDEVSLTVVNGSSLTPKGFMDALSKIKTEAKS